MFFELIDTLLVHVDAIVINVEFDAEWPGTELEHNSSE